MIYRISFGFSGMGQGWSETHAMLNASNKPQDLVPTLTDIAQKRAQMLGREFAIIGIRISRYATDAGVRTRGAYLVKQRFVNSVTTQSAAAEPAVVALLVRGSAEPSVINPQFDANQNQTFLGAPLDVCVDNAGVVDQGKGNLGAAFAAWRAAMLGTTMGWLANETIVNGDISNIAQAENGRTTFTMDEADLAPLTLGQSYNARARQINEGNSPLNGALIVKKIAPNQVQTQEVIGTVYEQIGGAMRIYKKVQPFVDYGDLVLSDTTAKHKRGLPFDFVPGRAKKRIRG